jgi:hypothetical protein
MGGMPGALAQQHSNIVQLSGDATVNGTRLDPLQVIQSGDEVQTAPGSTLVFVIGNSAFQVRQNTRLTVERVATLNAISLLRLLTGAVASVWGKGVNRAVVMPTLTAGIRGTGVYAEIFAERDKRNYFCNCYGTVDVVAGNQRLASQAAYQQSF